MRDKNTAMEWAVETLLQARMTLDAAESRLEAAQEEFETAEKNFESIQQVVDRFTERTKQP